jgi:hypothetical protein
MFYLHGRGISYFLLGLLNLTDPRAVTFLNLAQFCLCFFLILAGIVYFVCGMIPTVAHAYRPICLGRANGKIAVRYTNQYYEYSRQAQQG